METNQPTSDRTLTLAYVLVLGVIVALYRLAPWYVLPPETHLFWNLVPMGALSLFVGARLRTKYAYLLPVGVMLIADLLLIAPLRARGWSSFTWVTPLIYVSFAGYVLVGRLLREREWSPMVIGGAALLASMQFFLITNFGEWLRSSEWPGTPAGLLACYVSAVPFYRGTLLGDLIFSQMIFAFHTLMLRAVHSEKPLPTLPAATRWAPARIEGATPAGGITRRDEVRE
jgi:hypothetical protein